ncbi:hypothetical protein D3C80_1998160 [compost metagenome]
MIQAKLHRVDGGPGRQFIEGALDGEHVDMGAERTHGRGPEWHGQHKIQIDFQVGNFIQRNGIAVAVTFGLSNRD